jgi:hypothetical protein
MSFKPRRFEQSIIDYQSGKRKPSLLLMIIAHIGMSLPIVTIVVVRACFWYSSPFLVSYFGHPKGEADFNFKYLRFQSSFWHIFNYWEYCLIACLLAFTLSLFFDVFREKVAAMVPCWRLLLLADWFLFAVEFFRPTP